jgi:ankyrin repeat protein
MTLDEEKAFTAVAIGERDRLKALLEARPDLVNARNDDGDSLLLTAAYSGRKDLFELLLEKGAGVNVFEASALGLSDRVGEFLGADPSLANTYSHDGWTPLHLASFFGRKEVASVLLAHGADVNARSRSTRFAKENTPLHAAAANKQIALAELLLAHGADVNARDGSGYTPLALAANGKNDLLVVILLEKGALVT